MLDKGQTAIKAALNELDAAGLLERKRAGFSAANRLYVKLPPLVRISDPMTVGKATLISAENRPTDGRKSDLMTVGKPTPNNLTINNLIENQTMGVSGEYTFLSDLVGSESNIGWACSPNDTKY